MWTSLLEISVTEIFEMDLKEISTFSVYKLGSCNVSWLGRFCFFFPFILMKFSNCMSFHFKERSALSCSGHPVFWSWIPLLLQIFLGFKGVKSTGAESSLWQSFHTSVVQVPTKPMQHLCLLSKKWGDSVVILHSISQHQSLRKGNMQTFCLYDL